jgi:hypothetical protein
MLTDEQRRRVAETAIREAEIAAVLQDKVWKIVTRGVQLSADEIVLVTPDRHAPIERMIAELIVDAAEWKRRAIERGYSES